MWLNKVPFGMIKLMFRTRDFVLFFVAAVFLVMAIGATVWNQRDSDSAEVPFVQFVDTEEVEYSATVDSPETISRTERLSHMRQKIAESTELVLSSPEPELAVTEEAEPEQEGSSISTVLLCSDYAPFSGYWSATGVQIEEVEGARVVYREIPTEVSIAPAASATATESMAPAYTKETLLQLPASPIPSAQPACLPSDVIGVAKDGSLIRNSEVSLYGVFGSDTVVGYAFDGYPIYGTSDIEVDSCGGSSVAGSYGYYISPERETVLRCFTARPVSIGG